MRVAPYLTVYLLILMAKAQLQWELGYSDSRNMTGSFDNLIYDMREVPNIGLLLCGDFITPYLGMIVLNETGHFNPFPDPDNAPVGLCVKLDINHELLFVGANQFYVWNFTNASFVFSDPRTSSRVSSYGDNCFIGNALELRIYEASLGGVRVLGSVSMVGQINAVQSYEPAGVLFIGLSSAPYIRIYDAVNFLFLADPPYSDSINGQVTALTAGLNRVYASGLFGLPYPGVFQIDPTDINTTLPMGTGGEITRVNPWVDTNGDFYLAKTLSPPRYLSYYVASNNSWIDDDLDFGSTPRCILLSQDGWLYVGGDMQVPFLHLARARLSNSMSPTAAPTQVPTSSPSASPSATPTTSPTQTPSRNPTAAPSNVLTLQPSVAPTLTPSFSPTLGPSVTPTRQPSVNPTSSPSVTPTQQPSVAPTLQPSAIPTSIPTLMPTLGPTVTPTQIPSVSPTRIPTLAPSIAPTQSPSQAPSIAPTQSPSQAPSIAPTQSPSQAPTSSPTELVTVFIPGTVISGDVVFFAPTDISGGNLMVNGSITFADSSLLTVGSTLESFISVTGSVLLDGDLVLNLDNAPTQGKPVVVTVLTASSVSGAFDSINATIKSGSIASCETLSFDPSTTNTGFSVAVFLDTSACGLHPGIIGGIVVASLLLVIGLVFLLVFLYRRRVAREDAEKNRILSDNQLSDLKRPYIAP